jgi:glycosyltransferase involved in cell wall biosynthesis
MPLLPVNNKLGSSALLIGGWMDSLRMAIQGTPQLELGVASPSEIDYQCFEQDGVAFYNILTPIGHGTISAVLRRWQHTTEIPFGLSKCLEIVERFKPDIIHIHGSESFYGLMIAKTSIPVVLSIQGIMTIIENSYFGGYTFADKLRSLFSIDFIKGVGPIHNYLKLKKAAHHEIEIVKTCKYFIGRTEFDRNFVNLVNPKARYYHCDEILRPPFYLKQWELPIHDKKIIYCVTNSAPYKGLVFLLRAINILKNNGHNNIQLRISGDMFWDMIKKNLERLNLTEDVVLLGWTSPETMVSELKNADVFVHPSYIDNSPNSLGEAMLVGTPCIASYVGGVPSMIDHKKNGLLFPSGDAYSLAAMLAQLFENPSLAVTLSEGAKVTAKKRHDSQYIGAEIMNIY